MNWIGFDGKQKASTNPLRLVADRESSVRGLMRADTYTKRCRGAGHLAADSPGGLSEGLYVLAAAGSELPSSMMEIMDIHPRDLTSLFAGLVEKGLLNQDGSGRGTVYFLPAGVDATSEASSGGLAPSSGGLAPSSGGLGVLEKIAEVVASKKKASKTVVESTILRLCQERALSLDELSSLLNRSVDCIRKDYLQPMIRDKRLRYRYPKSPQHPEQAYISNEERKSK